MTKFEGVTVSEPGAGGAEACGAGALQAASAKQAAVAGKKNGLSLAST